MYSIPRAANRLVFADLASPVIARCTVATKFSGRATILRGRISSAACRQTRRSLMHEGCRLGRILVDRHFDQDRDRRLSLCQLVQTAAHDLGDDPIATWTEEPEGILHDAPDPPLHVLLQHLPGAVEPLPDSGLAQPQHLGRLRRVERVDHAQDQHLSVVVGQPIDRRLDERDDLVAPDLLLGRADRVLLRRG